MCPDENLLKGTNIVYYDVVFVGTSLSAKID